MLRQSVNPSREATRLNDTHNEVFRVTIPCSLVGDRQHFVRTYLFHLQDKSERVWKMAGYEGEIV
jgi:hypothetical protein